MSCNNNNNNNNNNKDKSDILIKLNYNEFDKLLIILRDARPYSIYAYYYILNLYKWYNQIKSEQLNTNVYPLNLINVYVPQSGITNGTFICIDLTVKFYSYCIYIFTIEKNAIELSECLAKTNIIDWLKSPLFGAVHQDHLTLVQHIVLERKMKIKEINECYYYTIDKEKVLQTFTNIKNPSNYQLDTLNMDNDLIILNSEWISNGNNCINSNESLKAIETFIKYNKTICLRNSAAQLIGWVLRNEYMAIGLLRVIDTEQRKGYAEYLVKLFCKEFIDTENLDPLAFIFSDNIPSQKLFQKLGFHKLGTCFWIEIK